MTQEQFVDKLIQLLKEAVNAGIEPDDVGALAENVLEGEKWAN